MMCASWGRSWKSSWGLLGASCRPLGPRRVSSTAGSVALPIVRSIARPMASSIVGPIRERSRNHIATDREIGTETDTEFGSEMDREITSERDRKTDSAVGSKLHLHGQRDRY
eukprot:6658045-Pyramimonas_sp.AAC.1